MDELNQNHEQHASSLEIRTQQLLAEIVEQDLQSHVVDARELTGGFYGRVYAVDIEDDNGKQEKVVVKTNTADTDVPFDQEPNDNRVYGARWSNFEPSYNLLVSHNLPVPSLRSKGQIEQLGVQYAVMDFIEGESVREFLAHEDHGDMDQLHALVGETMGQMHQITRDYQGWVDMDKKYARDWRESFFESMDSHLQNAAAKSEFVRNSIDQIRKYIQLKRSEWTDLKSFVFSHTDGFQGMAKFENNQWQLTGIIDLEDHQYTDPRFVLQGHELALEFEQRQVPPSFWAAYEKHTPLDPSYEKLKDLFKLYYLLSWLPGTYEDDRRTPELKEKGIRNSEQFIADIIES